MNDPDKWLVPALLFVFSLGCLLVGIIVGIVAQRRERRRMEPFCGVPGHVPVRDPALEELRERIARHDFGGDDAA